MVACPTCGKELTYIAQYDRLYCYAEGKYAPRGYGQDAPAIAMGPVTEESHEGHHHCPSCGKELAYIKEYDRWYCYAEGKYAPRDIQSVGAAKPVEALPAQPAVTAEAPIAEASPRPEEVPASTPVPQPPGPILNPVHEEPTTPEPEPAAETPAITPPRETPAETPATVEASATTPEVAPAEVPIAAPEQLAVEEPPKAAGEAPGRKPKPKGPKLTRAGVMRANRERLRKWCSAYRLDTMGTRVQLRDRLLAFMDENRIDAGDVAIVEAPLPEPAPVAEPAPEPAPVVANPEPNPVAAPEPEVHPEPAPKPEVIEPEPPAAVVPEVAPVEPEPAPIPILEPERAPEPAPTPPAEPAPEPDVEPAPAPQPEPVTTPSPEPPIMEPPKQEPAPEPRAASVPAPAPSPEPLKVEVEKALPCPTCGKDLTYIAQYDRLYCFSCGRYAPKTYGKEGVVEIPKPVETPPAAPVPTPVVLPPLKIEGPKPAPKAEHPCPTCGRELRLVREYDRWWCEAERKYAPKEVGKPPRYACPTCGQPLKWIEAYQRWYCYSEATYAPRTIPAPGAAVTGAVVTVAPAAVAVPSARVDAAAALAAVEQRIAALEQGRHAHKGAGVGIGLAAVGFSMIIVWFLFLPVLGPLEVLGLVDSATALAVFLQYRQILTLFALIGFILATAGVIAGLAGVRRRLAP